MKNFTEGFPSKKETPWDKFPHGTLVKSEINGETGVVLPHPQGDNSLMCNTFWVVYRKDGEPITQKDVDEIIVDPDNLNYDKFQGYLTNPSNCEYFGEVHIPQFEVVESRKNQGTKIIEFPATGTEGK